MAGAPVDYISSFGGICNERSRYSAIFFFFPSFPSLENTPPLIRLLLFIAVFFLHRCLYLHARRFESATLPSSFPSATGNDHERDDDAEVLEPSAARTHNPNFLFNCPSPARLLVAIRTHARFIRPSRPLVTAVKRTLGLATGSDPRHKLNAPLTSAAGRFRHRKTSTGRPRG